MTIYIFTEKPITILMVGHFLTSREGYQTDVTAPHTNPDSID